MTAQPRRRILVVEDEVIVARDIRLQLELLGYTVVGELRTGQEAVEQTPLLIPDLVLMDIQLDGEMSGIEAARHILDTTGTPIVFLTAYASGPILEEAKTINPAGYILKPFEERELRIVLEMAFYKAKVEYELRLKSNALSAAANAVVITDRNGVIEWANKAFTLYTGYTPDEAYGKKPGELLKSGQHPPEFYETMWATITRGEVWNEEIINRRKDGSTYHEQMTITPIFAPSGVITHFIAIKQDITKQKTLEKMYLRAQRLESIGTLAGGIAHDLNNILSPILMSGDLLLAETLPPDQARMVELILECARRGADVVRQVLAFARGEDGNRSEIQLRHLIADLINVSRETFPKTILIEESLPRDLWTVSADPTQIHQVLMNLMINARDAMPDGGTLTIAVSNQTLTATDPLLSSELRPGPHVIIRVTDTGTGIDPDILDNIFDPFFTTKAPGKGSGLGLSSAMGILRGHKGTLLVESTPGKTTTFTCILPAKPAAPQPAPPQELPQLPRGQGQRILAVDDEDSIRWMIRNTLQSLGYSVDLAKNGLEAIEKLTQPGAQPVDLLILDMMMPGMDGRQTLLALKDTHPALPVLLISGMLPEGTNERTDPLLTPHPFLPKPFSIEALAQLVAQILIEHHVQP